MKKYLIFLALCLFFGCGAEKTEISVVPESSSEPTGIKIQVKGQSYYTTFYSIELEGCEYFTGVDLTIYIPDITKESQEAFRVKFPHEFGLT